MNARTSEAPTMAALIRKLTERNIEGLYFRDGAPYRAKVIPPLAPGDVLLIGVLSLAGLQAIRHHMPKTTTVLSVGLSAGSTRSWMSGVWCEP